MNTKVVVFSNKLQYEEFISKLYHPEDFTVFCDDSSLYPYLNQRKIAYQPLDDFFIPRECWAKINAWCSTQTAKWLRLCQDQVVFEEVDFVSLTFLRFSYYLVSILRNYYYAKGIFESCKPSAVVAFDLGRTISFPKIQGNSFLNHFLKERAEANHIPVDIISSFEEKGQQSSDSARHRGLKEQFRRGFQQAYGKLQPAKGCPSLIVYGSLKHLSAVIEEICKRNISLVLFDDQFHLEQFLFAIRRKIPYYVPECFSNKGYFDRDVFMDRHRSDLMKGLACALSEKIFRYEDYDFGPFIEDQILSRSENYLKSLVHIANIYKNIHDTFQSSSWLLDETINSQRSYFACRARQQGVQVFCISHANLAVKFSVPEDCQVYGESIMYVHTLFEKKMYECRGWDGHQIVVTGSPRYDRLVRMRDRKRHNRRMNRKFRLFYCAASLRSFRPNEKTYLGMHVTNCDVVQIPSLNAILETIKGYPVKFIVKPHSVEGNTWHEFFKNRNSPNKCRIEEHSADFFKLLLECDAMILSHWSTALIESAICGIPTIVFDRYDCVDTASYMTQGGWCMHVKDVHGLKGVIKELCDGSFRRQVKTYPESRPSAEYYLGKNDGHNAQRVVDDILKRLQESSRVDVVKTKVLERYDG